MKKNRRWMAAALAVMIFFNMTSGSAFATDSAASREAAAVEREEELPERSSAVSGNTAGQSATGQTEEEPSAEDTTVSGNTAGQEVELSQISVLPEDDAFNEMCMDIFGKSASEIVDNSDYAEIYVGYNVGGEHTGTPGTPEKPYGSLEAAYSGVAGKSGVVIHLMESYKDVLDEIAAWPVTDVPSIIISDAYESAFLHMSAPSWDFRADTGFYNVQVDLNYSAGMNSAIYANGNTLVFGGHQRNNFVFRNDASDRYYPTLFGAGGRHSGTAAQHGQVSDTNLKVYGGRWSQIFGGGEMYSDVTGTAALTIDGSYYAADGALQQGAVAFENTHLAYMEGSSNIYGGGAGNFTLLSSSEHGNVNGSVVQLAYVTTEKDVTPCGGWMGSYASITLDHVTAKGVNARSEGRAADKVDLIIKNSTIKEKVGALGSNYGGVQSSYIYAKEISDFNITIESSVVNGTVSAKSGGLSGADHNNSVTGVDISIKDSIVNRLAVAELPADYSHGTVERIYLEDSDIKTYSSSANFGEIKEIILKDMGEFLWKDYQFGANYNQSNRESEGLYVEGNTNVHFTIPYQTGMLTVNGGKITLDPGLTLEAESYYSGGENSKIELHDGSIMKISGTASGINTTVIPVLKEENSRVQVVWKRADGSGDLDLFKQDSSCNYFEKKIYAPVMNMCCWYNGNIEQNSYIYVDGQNGHDSAEGYANSECTEEILGYDSRFPVKTLGKAYELCKSEDEKIVICGPYEIAIGESEQELLLIESGQKKLFPVTITSKDDLFDYREQAYIKFKGSAQAGRLDIREELIFDDIDFVTELPEGGRIRIFSNGYKTVYGAGVTAKKSENTRLELYGGAYNAGVASTELYVRALNVNLASAGGYGDQSYVGNRENRGEDKAVVAKLDVNLTKKYSNILEVNFYGDAYGSVQQTLDFNKNFLDKLHLNLKSNRNHTIYGDFINELCAEEAGGTIYAYVSPPDQIVTGEVLFLDQGNNNYKYVELKEGQYTKVNIDIKKSSMEYSQLFTAGTNASEVNWKLSGKVGAVYGTNDHVFLQNRMMEVNVELDATGNTIMKAGNREDTDPFQTGYAKKDNVRVILRNFDVSNMITSLQGFGSVTFDNCQCMLDTVLYTTNLSVTNGSEIQCMQEITVGQEGTQGRLSLLKNGSMIVNSELSLAGDMLGEEEKEAAGTLENNWVNAQDETECITVAGTVTGYIYYTTSYDSASILVKGMTNGTEYMIPKGSEGTPSIQISCEPGIEDGEQADRIWTVTNPVSKKVIFVNGTVNKEDPSYASHDGSIPERAYATLAEGYDAVLNGGTIVICGDTTVPSWPENPKAVTITSKMTIGTGENSILYDYFSESVKERASLSITEKNIELKNDTVFEYLNINNSTVITIGACGYKLTMGHQGDEQSLVMSGQPINVGGGSNTTAIDKGINTDVTIHAGTYRTVSGTNSYGNTGIYTKYSSVTIKIFGGVFDKIYVKGNLYDNFNAIASSPELAVENATVNTGIYAMECNYSVGSKLYRIDIGQGMSFSENAVIVAGTDRANYGNALPDVDLVIDGSGGEAYRIPVISTGKARGSADIKNSNFAVSIKGATVGTFYGGLSANNNISARDIRTELSLYENAAIDRLYFGGKNTAGASTVVSVHSPSVQIGSIIAGSESNTNEIPATAELNFIGIGEEGYQLQQGISLDGLTKVTVKDSNLDLTNVGSDIRLGTLDVSEGDITCRKNIINLYGDYIGGTEESPAAFYGWRAPNLTIKGTVSGVTQVRSLAPDPSANNEVTGKFYYGITIKASSSQGHSEKNFECLQDDLEGDGLEFSSMTFMPGGEDQMDQWAKENEEDQTDRTQIFVSTEEGADSNTGTYVSPVKTIGQAYRYAEQLYQESRKTENPNTEWDIVLLDDVIFGGDMPSNLTDGYSVTIKSENSQNTTNKLILQGQFHVPVDTTFDNITIRSDLMSGFAEIFADGHELICSENLRVEAQDRHYPILYGGSDNEALEKTNLKVYGGTWNQIFGGSKNADVNSSSLIIGGKADTLNIGTVDEGSTGVFGGGMNGTAQKVSLTIEGGTYYRIFGGGMKESAKTGEITVNYNYGEIARLYGGGQNAETTGNIQVNIGTVETGREEAKAAITEAYRGSGLYAGLSEGKKAVTNVYSNAVISEETQFAAGGYSGTLDATELFVYGGTILCDMYAGGWGEGTDGTYGTVKDASSIVVEGGTITGNIYGGGKLAVVSNEEKNAVSRVQIQGGNITGNVYGGGNAAGVNSSEVTISSDVAGNVFGGSENITSDSLQIQKKSEVLLKDCTVNGSVFGGSDTSGLIDDAISVTVSGEVMIEGEGNGIYGGGSKALLEIRPMVTVSEGAQVTGNIYGGGKGEIKSESLFKRAIGFLTSLTALFDAEPSYDLSNLSDANVPSTEVMINGAVIGNVYGGGEMATVGSSEGNTWKNDVTHITLSDGASVTGNIYGGGKGQSDRDYAVIYGNTKVELNGGSVTVGDDQENTKTAGAVFGGGEIAPVAGNTGIIARKGTFSNLFGGNDVEGEINGETSVELPADSAAVVAHVYGGGRDAAHKNVNKTVIRNGAVTEVYGGGYGIKANSSKAEVSIEGGTVEAAYGGGNAAPTESAKLAIKGGSVTVAYAGGNAATVTESAEIVVDTADAEQHVVTVFAGNNAATMTIQPTLTLTKGKIGSLYCGGNAGVMEIADGLKYSFDYPQIQIETVYAGCNDTTVGGDQAQTADVELKLISGEYETVYGGNNANGYMEYSHIEINQAPSEELILGTVYGGGRQADAKHTKVTLRNGTVATVYGGGNNATVTGSVTIEAPDMDNHMVVKELYCGNNAADMGIAPVVDFKGITITDFYGGGNKGRMTAPEITYSLSGENTEITTAYGGCNQADVTGKSILNLDGSTVGTVYGGCNTSGTMGESEVNVNGGAGTVYGGGRGEDTYVAATNVNLRNGIISGNVYGGSGHGRAETSCVTAREKEGGKVAVLGHVFGAGYGQSSSVVDANVIIDLKLAITDKGNDSLADVLVSETVKETDSTSGESSASAAWLSGKSYQAGSYIEGNVFGGGDMGQIGSGFINNSTNTAVIHTEGSAKVLISGGYIHGNVFGGGNGQPGVGTDYNTYMGTVFGTSRVKVTGGYVNGNLFGCGQQSRTYAASDQDNDGSGQDASYVKVEEGSTPTLIGGSIFGGGNKGNGSTQNAAVATVYGDTHVAVTGKEGAYTRIYMLSDGNTGGGVYGDGNLCLVSGKKYVTLKNFSCGTENTNLLKTFYSLQRADIVDLIGSRIVLKGAVDLVAENVDDTKYSVNRVGQLNLKESSTVKLVQTVNLLAELTSDEQTERQFINKGNNDGNAYVAGNAYIAHGGSAPSDPLIEEEVNAYIQAYESYYGTSTSGKLPKGSLYASINVVCVANGGYLEVKKSTAEYGPVSGLFTLQLLNAVPGEGGGFVYASIDGKKVSKDTYATGNFVCVTKDGETSDDYMIAYHDVGGYYDNQSKKYEYYLWYLKGNKYNYDVDLTAFIGTTDTEFSKSISLPVETDKKELMLATMTQEGAVQGLELEKTWKNTWEDSDNASDRISLKLELVKNVREEEGSSIITETSPIGFIGYQTKNNQPTGEIYRTENGEPIWGIWRKVNEQWRFQASELTEDNQTSMKIDDGDTLGSIGGENVVNAQLHFTLYKGTGMTTEFKNLPFEMMIAEVNADDYAKKGNIDLDSCIRLIDAIRLSAIRLVPTQAAYIGSGRLFAGVSSSTNVDVTKTSAFTAQFVTKYIPSAFNTGSVNNITETLVTSYHDVYLVDEKGVGYKIQEEEDGSITILNKTNVSDLGVTDYKISKENEGYKVTYTRTGENETEVYSCTAIVREGRFTIPKGTVITLLASLDDADATYWYYYCEQNESEIPLEKFRQMNTAETSNSRSTVYDAIFSTSSSRVTENMIFVFDFSNVTSEEWMNVPLNGDVMLKHTYDGYDIMEYVASEKQSDGSIQYTHETPRATGRFEFSEDSDGISSFVVSNVYDESDEGPTYYQNDTMDFTLNINPDTSTTNTTYEEREYAVILTLQKDNKEIPFPEGTTASYNGKQLIAGTENKYFIVPVKTVDTHQVTLSTNLRGLEAGSYNLKGALYATSATGYYNSIPVTHEADDDIAPFHVQPNPEYVLKVEEGNGTGVQNHLAKVGQNFSFTVTAIAEGEVKEDDTSSVEVNLYHYHTNGSEQGRYQKIPLNKIFEGMPELSETEKTWDPTVVQGAEAGTYRLEFIYHDKTEYWDFVIR